MIIEVGSDPPIVLDLGTGLRPLGLELDASGACDDGVELVAFLSHLHWDHIIGLPFFTTAHHPGRRSTYTGRLRRMARCTTRSTGCFTRRSSQ